MDTENVFEWLKQRRVWAGILSALAVFFMTQEWSALAGLSTTMAGLLSVASYVMPKEVQDGKA